MKFNLIYAAIRAAEIYSSGSDDPAGKLDYATPGSCALDVRACIDAPIFLAVGAQTLIPLGIKIQLAQPLEDKDFRVGSLLLPRSGRGFKEGLVLGNTVGLIDEDYQGEIMAAVWHRPTSPNAKEPLVINPGERIAQLLIIPVLYAEFNVVTAFPSSARAAGGFGSTGHQ